MEIQIPDKLYQIMSETVPDALDDWIITVLEDATEDCVFIADDDDVRKEWEDYCKAAEASLVANMFKGSINEQE